MQELTRWQQNMEKEAQESGDGQNCMQNITHNTVTQSR